MHEGLKTQQAVARKGSVLSRYQDVVIGRRSLLGTIYYEWCAWLAPVPGAMGLFLRKLFWRYLFGSCGKGVTFARNIILRHPHRIHLADRVVISEGCILDARNPYSEEVIVLENDIILSNNVMISCKGGSVRIGERTGIGAQTIISSGADEPVKIGKDVIIGPRCYIVGGGNYKTDRIDMPIREQGKLCMGGSTLEDDIWLGANVTVLGNVTIHSGSIGAAGAVITKTIPKGSVCMGVPARVVKTRTANSSESYVRRDNV
jgi:galactoside O-acetyltransferase